MASSLPIWRSELAAADPAAHTPVMLMDVLQQLEFVPAGRYLDLTFGRGGYARAMLERMRGGELVACDQDPDAIRVATDLAQQDSRVTPLAANFGELEHSAVIQSAPFDGIVADLGVSSPQLDRAERGFSFRLDGPLDMRMNPQVGQSAAEWLAAVPTHELIRVLQRLGEDPQARRIGLAIARAREAGPITRTAQLAHIVESAVGGRRGRRTHPATRTFQAIRMQVNRELEVLQALLDQVHGWLKPGGRLVVVSFHSLEDRAVKRMLQAGARPKAAHPALPDPTPLWSAIGRVRCSELEAARNPRARSATLRWGQTWTGATC